MKFRKAMALLLAGTMALSMAACGGGSSSSSSDSSSSDAESTDSTDSSDSSDVTLSVTIWDSNQEPGLTQIMNDFTEKTGIKTKVSVVKWDEYWTLLESGAQGGSLPDVFWMHSNESERYMSNDMLLDLTDKIADSSEIDPANYPEDIWGLYTYDDKYYAVPKDVDTIALWYNKTLFDEAGLEYPTADWTWDDVTEAAKKLTKDDGSQYGLAMGNGSNQDGYYNMVYDNGGYIINDDKTQSGWDDPKTIEAMQTMEGWINDGVMPSLETMSENGNDVLFESGKVAMITQGSWMLAAYRDNEYTAANCDCVELPKSATTGRRASIYNGLGWAASATTEHPDEAWQLIEYLGSKEAQENPKTIEAMQTMEGWINDGVMPSLETMSENGNDVLFESGKVAMITQGSWMLAAYRDNEYTAANCDCVELPKSATTGRRASIYNGLGWAASATTEHPDEAWQLIEYLGSKEAQEKQAELGVTMSAYTGTSDAWAKSADFNLQAYLNMMDDMVIRPYSRTTVTWENEDSEIMKDVFSGDKTMEEACKAMADQMNECLADEQ